MNKITFFLIYFSLCILGCVSKGHQGLELNQIQVNWDEALVTEFDGTHLIYPGGPAMFTSFSWLSVAPGVIIVWDAQGEYPLYRVDVLMETIEGFGSWGQGPGELMRGMPKVLSATEETIYVYEYALRALHLFTHNLTYTETIYVEGIEGFFGLLYAHKDGTFFYRNDDQNPSEESQYLYQNYVIKNGIFSPTDNHFVTLSDYPELEPLKSNAALKFGPIVSDNDGNLFAAHWYSTFLSGISQTGSNLFSTQGPSPIFVEPSTERRLNQVVVYEPEEAVFCALGLTVDESYLYMLFDGRKISYESMASVYAGLPSDTEHIGASNKLRVFSKSSGNFLGEISLPGYATGVLADESYLYVLHSGENVLLQVFNKALLFQGDEI